MNLIVLATVIYVLVAVAMVVLILMQRGAGAQAGSGFGAGASATVFGASGSANFLSSTTKWLAVVFFAMSLGLAWSASKHGGRLLPAASDDVGLMSEAVPAAADAPVPAVAEVPAAEAPVAPAPEAAPSGVGAPASETATPTAENPPEGESGG
ncbi:MAG: preprotein translocase subunit SecG [Lysobacteraceae bacterium]